MIFVSYVFFFLGKPGADLFKQVLEVAESRGAEVNRLQEELSRLQDQCHVYSSYFFDSHQGRNDSLVPEFLNLRQVRPLRRARSIVVIDWRRAHALIMQFGPITLSKMLAIALGVGLVSSLIGYGVASLGSSSIIPKRPLARGHPKGVYISDVDVDNDKVTLRNER